LETAHAFSNKRVNIFICFNYFELIIGVEENDLKWGESKIHENTSNLNLLDIIEKGEDHPDLMVPSKDSRYDTLTYYWFSIAFVLIMLSVLKI